MPGRQEHLSGCQPVAGGPGRLPALHPRRCHRPPGSWAVRLGRWGCAKRPLHSLPKAAGPRRAQAGAAPPSPAGCCCAGALQLMRERARHRRACAAAGNEPEPPDHPSAAWDLPVRPSVLDSAPVSASAAADGVPAEPGPHDGDASRRARRALPTHAPRTQQSRRARSLAVFNAERRGRARLALLRLGTARRYALLPLWRAACSPCVPWLVCALLGLLGLVPARLLKRQRQPAALRMRAPGGRA
jgi:hypothetical protein